MLKDQRWTVTCNLVMGTDTIMIFIWYGCTILKTIPFAFVTPLRLRHHTLSMLRRQSSIQGRAWSKRHPSCGRHPHLPGPYGPGPPIP